MRFMGRQTRAVPLCLRALGRLKDERAVEPVCRMVSSESVEVRREAVLALVALSEGPLSEGTRAMVRETLAAAGVPLESKGLRPMEVRRTRSGSPSMSGRSQVGAGSPSAPEPMDAVDRTTSSRIISAPPTTPTPAQVPARPVHFQNLPPGTRL